MSSIPEIQTFAGRLATFDGPQQVAKRRASSVKKKTQSAVSWPHETPSPEQLAKAGFFYKPSASSEDSVTCFLCNKALDGWDANDNPAFEHLNHVPHCGWAINVCIEQRIDDMDRAEEDPMSEKMVEARRATYKDSWPHEGKKGWKCKVQKMVAAGWYYSPLPEADDCVVCAYCGISLDGWEPKDDPKQEHEKRAPECHFFSLVEESANLKAQIRGTKGRASRTARGSKASRVSTQSNLTLHDDTEIRESTLANEDALEGDSIMTTVSTTSKAGRGRNKASKPKAASTRTRTTRGIEKAALESSMLDAEPSADVEGTGRVSSATVTIEPESSQTKRPRQKRATKKAKADESIIEPSSHIEGPLPKRAASRKKAARQADEPELDDKSQSNEANEIATAQPKAQARRGRKRMSNGAEKIDSSVIIIEDIVPQKETKPKARTKTQRQKANANIEDRAAPSDAALAPEQETNDHEPAAEEVSTEEAPTRKTTKARKASSQVVKQHSIVPVHEDNSATNTSEPANAQSQAIASPAPAQTTTTEGEETRPAETAPSPAPTTTHQRARPPSPPPQSPQPSQQSSDAENEPPSLRASKSRLSKSASKAPVSPRSDQRPPLQTITPHASPSKRSNTIPGGLTSTAPWTAANLDTAFLPWLTSNDDDNVKENGNGNGSGGTVLGGLTSPEKRMSVEEWILWNAGRAEEELRRRCEGMIGSLEGEGMRALQGIEGVSCL